MLKALASGLLLAAAAPAARAAEAEGAPPRFQKIVIVVLENASYQEAMAQTFLASFASSGAVLSQFYAEGHPSQPNYIALASGSTYGVRSDWNVTLDVRHIGDLLEARGKSWKVYAEGYPGGCFLKRKDGRYARKHVPLLSFKNVQDNPQRCARVVNASQFAADAAGGALPEFSLYIPDLRNDGHDTGAAFASRWLERWMGQTLGPSLKDPALAKGLVVAVTFDEDDGRGPNRIYTALYGDGVRAGAVSTDRFDHYSLLRTVEDAFGLGTLGQNDDRARPITGVWR